MDQFVLKNKKKLIWVISFVLFIPSIMYLVIGNNTFNYRLLILAQAFMYAFLSMIGIFLVIGFQVINPMCNKELYVFFCYFPMFVGFIAFIISLLYVCSNLESGLLLLYLSAGTIVTSYFMKVKYTPKKIQLQKERSHRKFMKNKKK